MLGVYIFFKPATDVSNVLNLISNQFHMMIYDILHDFCTTPWLHPLVICQHIIKSIIKFI